MCARLLPARPCSWRCDSFLEALPLCFCAQDTLAAQLWKIKAPMEPEEVAFEVLLRVGDVLHAVVMSPVETRHTQRRQLYFKSVQIRCAPGSTSRAGYLFYAIQICSTLGIIPQADMLFT